MFFITFSSKKLMKFFFLIFSSMDTFSCVKMNYKHFLFHATFTKNVWLMRNEHFRGRQALGLAHPLWFWPSATSVHIFLNCNFWQNPNFWQKFNKNPNFWHNVFRHLGAQYTQILVLNAEFITILIFFLNCKTPCNCKIIMSDSYMKSFEMTHFEGRRKTVCQCI